MNGRFSWIFDFEAGRVEFRAVRPSYKPGCGYRNRAQDRREARTMDLARSLKAISRSCRVYRWAGIR